MSRQRLLLCFGWSARLRAHSPHGTAWVYSRLPSGVLSLGNITSREGASARPVGPTPETFRLDFAARERGAAVEAIHGDLHKDAISSCPATGFSSSVSFRQASSESRFTDQCTARSHDRSRNCSLRCPARERIGSCRPGFARTCCTPRLRGERARHPFPISMFLNNTSRAPETGEPPAVAQEPSAVSTRAGAARTRTQVQQ